MENEKNILLKNCIFESQKISFIVLDLTENYKLIGRENSETLKYRYEQFL